MFAVTPDALAELRQKNKVAAEAVHEEFENWYAALKEQANAALLDTQRRIEDGKDESVVLVLVRAREARYVDLLTKRLCQELRDAGFEVSTNPARDKLPGEPTPTYVHIHLK